MGFLAKPGWKVKDEPFENWNPVASAVGSKGFPLGSLKIAFFPSIKYIEITKT